MRPSGIPHTLTGRLGDQDAVVTIASVAAALRGFTVGGAHVVQPYPDDAIPPLGAGIVMVPWPNRVDGGRWQLEGEAQQLDITEVGKQNALHGLLRWTAYDVVGSSPGSVELSATIFAPNGYPFVVESVVRYALTDEGLEVTHTLRNLGTGRAPVAVGTHPYFRVGDAPTAELTLTSSAATVYVDDERALPIRREAVSGGTDLRGGRRVADLALDHCFTDLELVGGRSSTTLTAPDGRSVEVWADAAFAYQVLLTTGEFEDEPGGRALAVAIEPQTCAVDAFNSGEGLHWLDAGEGWTVRWGVVPRLHGAAG